MRPRKHVLSDLQPYICTYPDCQLNDYFFENKDNWYNHESCTHRVEWFCNTASHKSFVDMQEFLDHMHTVHSEPLDGTQLLSLHRGFQRPTNAHSGTCTLCGKHANKLKSHLARHLEQLALFAIPQTDYMADLEQDDTSSNAARQGIPELSSPGSSKIGSEVSSYQSDPEVESLEIDHRELHTGGIKNTQSTENNEKTVIDKSVDSEDEIDTSWDEITPKFKEARTAMRNDHEVELFERKQGSDAYSERPKSSRGWSRINLSSTHLPLPPSALAKSGISYGIPEEEDDHPLADSPNPHSTTKPIHASTLPAGHQEDESHVISSGEERKGLLARSRSREWPQIPDQDQDPTEPSAKKEDLDVKSQPHSRKNHGYDSTSPSLRQRAGSVTSKLLSPFRSRSKVQSAEYPPMPGEQPRRIIVERVPSGSYTPRRRKDPLFDQPTESVISKPFSPSRRDNPERWPEVPGETLRFPNLDTSRVWYCSSCGDGPQGTWQNVCTACNHSKCSNCTLEIAN
jgi:hypothetical protein